MRRLFALIVLALSLAMASGPAFALPKAACPMAGMEHMAGGHEDMGCCTATCAPDCATICPGAVIPHPGRAAAPAEIGEQVAAAVTAMLRSADLAAADPPPRTTFS